MCRSRGGSWPYVLIVISLSGMAYLLWAGFGSYQGPKDDGSEGVTFCQLSSRFLLWDRTFLSSQQPGPG